MRVLLIEDDVMIGQVVQAALRDAAYAADWVEDGERGISAMACQEYDIVLLDLGLPRKSGIDVLRDIRARGSVIPVVILTARDALDDRVSGLDAGADDYLVKPFEMAEMLARMRAVWRRKGGAASSALRNGTLCLDLNTRQAQIANEAPIPLTGREFSLLQALMMRPGAILSRAELEERIYGWGDEVESNAVEYLIHALRKKLGAAAIRNVRGLGWLVPKQD
ncbi:MULTISPECIES: response regulator transcription factor [unclassified Cupriavidus]|uniref:response regulator n=1 Tax=unclassified Cupriavidus TaxID=2640874 RepID=UPI001C002751|nr:MULTISPECIES: response regulator transcription factor [unclassified Cupriavidus]MCA3190897.1 response regulator transcription factor [Cupriavidus sp.]MCA3196504.1 response regulator transcription factor [Cupriavidus sp.]MCA3205394.1 response regulator transcription factor [Cupriavidus sp.]MCA3206234.1 response regulator transcription factor [Cupriavidus sp.]MCA3232169.1 response regulator transcription factor [Cupriavidus sp.]